MATTLAMPLISPVSTSHHGSSFSPSRHDQAQCRPPHVKTRRPLPLPRIPSERLDPRSETFSQRMGNHANVRIPEQPKTHSHLNQTTLARNGPVNISPSHSPQLLSAEQETTQDIYAQQRLHGEKSPAYTSAKIHRTDAAKIPFRSRCAL